MSHFTVGVITENGFEEEVAKLLAPFDENLDVKTITPKEDIIAKGRKWIEDYKESELYKKFKKDPVAYGKDKNAGHMNFLMRDFPKMLKMSDEEIFALETEDVEPEDILDDGSVVSYYNPQSKWDWWVIGGRWDSSIPTKSDNKVNTVKISEIDFSPAQDEIDHYAENWDVRVNGAEKTRHDYAYMDVPSKEQLLKVYGTKENYIKAFAGFSTYATLTPSGDWHEPGQMGWFGTSTATDASREEYKKNIKDIMDKYSDHYLTLVDCHI